MDVAVGFAAHSGWAIAVVAGLVDGHLRVYDRRRVDLISPDLPRQAYHAAADIPAGEASELVAAVDSSIVEHACDALASIRDAVSEHALVAVGVIGRPRDIPDVATVLASHSLMHASEGEQYRRGLATAAERLNLPVQRLEPRQLTARIADVVGWPPARLADEQTQVRAALGPPWQKDHKEAATAAVVALG